MQESIVALISSAVLPYLLQLVKKVAFIPINEGQTGRIRLLKAILALAVGFGNAFVTGEINADALKGSLDALLTAGISYLATSGLYHHLKKKTP